jgi:LDH2 family malate/lactate/ureidoglycolate dehydrogenase
MTEPRSKLALSGPRVTLSADEARSIVESIFLRLGCGPETARAIAEHLTDASLCGVESHGLMRALQYVEQMESGYLRAEATPRVLVTDRGVQVVDGGEGIGIPAMQLAYDHAMKLAHETGLSAVAIRKVGHTGRLGAYAEQAGENGFLTICTGGGNRKAWRQVAPHGGAKAMLPTNPWCIGIPGGERGPVVLDFATSKIAGGWIYAARSAGALLPEGCLIDRNGKPTRDPEDYFDGGAILPAGGHKGYGLALMGEMIAEAMLGPSTTECHWLLIAIDAGRYRETTRFHEAAEELLAEMRACPPAPGFERVEVPGERERDHRRTSAGTIAVPERTWRQILELAERLGAII